MNLFRINSINRITKKAFFIIILFIVVLSCSDDTGSDQALLSNIGFVVGLHGADGCHALNNDPILLINMLYEDGKVFELFIDFTLQDGELRTPLINWEPGNYSIISAAIEDNNGDIVYIIPYVDLDPNNPLSLQLPMELTITQGTDQFIGLDLLLVKEFSKPDIQIDQLSAVTNCDISNGSLGVTILEEGNAVTEGYTFEWYSEFDFTTTIGTEAIIKDLDTGSYTVNVKSIENGCEIIESALVLSNIVSPQIQVTIISHSHGMENGGSIEASSIGEVQGYTFNWYHGNTVKEDPDFTGSGAAGSVYSGLAPGFYTVELVDESTGCVSVSETVEIES